MKTLPAPSLDDAWKPLTTAKTSTAFFTAKKPKGPVESVEESTLHPDKKIGTIEKNSRPDYIKNTAPAAGSDPEEMRSQMTKQMQELMKKFENLEEKHKRDTKNEVLLFVGTGLFILVSLDIVARLSRK